MQIDVLCITSVYIHIDDSYCYIRINYLNLYLLVKKTTYVYSPNMEDKDFEKDASLCEIMIVN